MNFGAVIIGDEILSGKRQDKHFARIAALLSERGLGLSWVEYLRDEPSRLIDTFRRTMSTNDIVFSCGGIGNTPDDHTRQAVAEALGVTLLPHPQGLIALQERFGDAVTPERVRLVTFPSGAEIIPNPFNGVPGFMISQHYFLPGFPQMAHPMIAWVLDTYHRDCFRPALTEKAFVLTGEGAYESTLLDLMERIVQQYPSLRLFSLPSISAEGKRQHLELGVEGESLLVEQAMQEIQQEIELRGINWVWRHETEKNR